MPRDKSERNVRIVNEYLTDLPARVLEQVASGGCVCPPARVRDMSPAPTPLKKGEPFSPAEMLVCSLFVALKPRTGGKRKRDVHPLGVLAPDEGAKKTEDYGGQTRPRLSGEEMAARIAAYRKVVERGGSITAHWEEEAKQNRKRSGSLPLLREVANPHTEYSRPTVEGVCKLAMWYGEKGLLNRDVNDNRRSNWQCVMEYAKTFEEDWSDDEKEFIEIVIKREYPR